MLNNYLKLITKSGLDMNMPVSNKRLVATKGNPFAYIDSNFNVLIGVNAVPCPRMSVYKVKSGNCLDEWLNSLAKKHESLCIAEQQIAGFCKIYRQWLSPDPVGTFFIFEAQYKSLREVHFAQVLKKKETLSIYHGNYTDRTEKFDIGSDIRIVTPFLIT